MTTSTIQPGRRPRRPAVRAAAVAACVATAVATGAAAPAASAAASGTIATGRHAPAFPPDVTATLDADLRAVVDAGAVGVVGYARDGDRRTWSGAAGVRHVDRSHPAEPGDVARIGSVTKAMVATLVMQEVDRGRWTLGTTVDDVLPGLLPEHGDVTLEQLLGHRSGLPEFIPPVLGAVETPEQFVEVLRERRTDRELVRAALTQPWLFEPGTQFSYSNTNYVVAGMMLERANHLPLRVLLRWRVFLPAGMRDARYPVPGRTFSGPDHLGDYAIFDRPYELDHTSSTIFSAAGAVVASAPDIARFYRSLFAGRLVSKASLQEMTEPRSTDPLVYGLGIYAIPDPCPGPDGETRPLYGHDGATFGTLTVVFTSADGERQVSIAWGGRDVTQPIPPTTEPANRFLVDALVATCERPVPPGARARTAESVEGLPAWTDLGRPVTGGR
ncbi:beta-lactamase family protein [Phycicoccus sp. CSK15P-2]|uniref:serine hydrolase domain-containing protein n=1 Tax=Phycicoccus sp. CSK15P-2 TaxID=2807627 RepID=UPI001950DDD3|nr:serine hydrolase domain-containing protein [Phycicoccus sp. CSK15P-2]MBM6403105.1 beta-lactamase family protein [Phycicoccus sp. CSK15P-2]